MTIIANFTSVANFVTLRHCDLRHRPQRPNRLYGLVYEIYRIGLLSGSRFYPIANRLPTRPDIYKISALYKSFTYLLTYLLTFVVIFAGKLL